MPNARLHRAIATLYGVPDSGPVDHILDSTAHQHGSHHRRDPVHSLVGASRVLAMKGQLTPENVRAVAVHLTADRMLDRIMEGTGLKGERRKVVKQFIEYQLAEEIARCRR